MPARPLQRVRLLLSEPREEGFLSLHAFAMTMQLWADASDTAHETAS